MDTFLLKELCSLVGIHLAEDFVDVTRVCHDDNVVDVDATDALSTDAGLYFDEGPIGVLLVVWVAIVRDHDLEAAVAESLDCSAELGVFIVNCVALLPLVVEVLPLELLADELLVLWHVVRGILKRVGVLFSILLSNRGCSFLEEYTS